MRLLIFSLIVVNVLFFAWAQWIDVPAAPNTSTANLPALQLAPAVAGSAPAAPGVSTPSGIALASASTAPASAMGAQPAASCFSIGPYADAASATRVATVLQGRGLSAQQRAAVRAETSGFWDYIPPLKNAAEASKAQKALERAGVKEVDVMSQPEYAGRISVGLFDDEAHAKQRAVEVRALGYTVAVEPRQRQINEYWLDLSPSGSAPAVAIEDATLSNGSTLQKTACPAAGTAAPPAG